MSDAVIKMLSGILLVAIIAVIISKNARTSSVIQSAASAFSNILATVVAPISGGGAGAPGDAGAVVIETPETGNTSQNPADPGADNP